MKNTGGPVFPQHQVDFGRGLEEASVYGMGGMELRDYFAAHAQINDDYSIEAQEKIVGRKKPKWTTDKENALEILQFEAEFDAILRGIKADAMIAERNKI